MPVQDFHFDQRRDGGVDWVLSRIHQSGYLHAVSCSKLMRLEPRSGKTERTVHWNLKEHLAGGCRLVGGLYQGLSLMHSVLEMNLAEIISNIRSKWTKMIHHRVVVGEECSLLLRTAVRASWRQRFHLLRMHLQVRSERKVVMKMEDYCRSVVFHYEE